VKIDIDVESEDVVEANKQTRVAIINDTMSIKYLQDNIFADFKGKKDKVFIAIRIIGIIGENDKVRKEMRGKIGNLRFLRFMLYLQLLFDLLKEEEVTLGWNYFPLFLKEDLNYGSFSLPLIVPSEPIVAPLLNK